MVSLFAAWNESLRQWQIIGSYVAADIAGSWYTVEYGHLQNWLD